MITESDNTATDVSLKVAGGPEAVTKMLRSIGITEQRVDRYCCELLRDFYGLQDKAYGLPIRSCRGNCQRPNAPIKDDLIANLEFEKDPRDQSTPKAMLELLLAIDSGKVLSEKSRDIPACYNVSHTYRFRKAKRPSAKRNTGCPQNRNDWRCR